jgi:hypothetical protein
LVDAYGGPELQVQQSVMTAFAEALKISKSPLVPQTVIMGGSDGKAPNAMEGIMSMVLANMASSNGSVLTKPKDTITIKEPVITKQEDSISAKKSEI